MKLIRRIVNFELPARFCQAWHTLIMWAHLVGGGVVTFISAHEDVRSVAGALFLTVTVVILGTLCFMFYPLFWIAVSIFTRFLPVLGLGAYAIVAVGNIFGDGTPLGTRELLAALSGSLWGWFNIRTAIIANRDPEFNPFFLFD